MLFTEEKTQHCNHPLKGELILAIDDTCKDDAGDEDNEVTSSQQCIDRGGLCHAKDVICMVFVAMEDNLQHHRKSVTQVK